MAWIGLLRPADAQLHNVADEFGLHEVALEDAIVAHQRPKLERYDDMLFVVLKAATYLDDVEEVDFGEIHVFIGTDFVITVRHSLTPDLSAVRRRMEGDPDLLRLGPEAVLYAIVDSVVDGYAPVVAGLQKDIDEIETEVFRGDPSVSRRIYELSREVIEFQRSVRPLLAMLNGLQAGFEKYGTDEELRRYLRDTADHATIVAERVDTFRQMLSDILTVNATLVNQAQNEEIKALTESTFDQNEQVKRISAWAAILFAPDPYRQRLRHELRKHAGAGLGLRLPLRHPPDVAGQRPALLHFPPPRLALMPRPGRVAAAIIGLVWLAGCVSPTPAVPSAGGAEPSAPSACPAISLRTPGGAVINLTGRWRSPDGGTYYLRQSGSCVWFAGFSADTGSPGGEGTSDWTNSFFGHLSSNFTLRGSWADLPWGADVGVGILDWRLNFDQVDDEEAVTLEVIDVSGGFGADFLVKPETREELVVRLRPTEGCIAVVVADDGTDYQIVTWPDGWDYTTPPGILGPNDEQITPSDSFAISGEVARGRDSGPCGARRLIFVDQMEALTAP